MITPNRLVGANEPAQIPLLMAIAIRTASTPARRAVAMPTGPVARPACGEPIAAISAASPKNSTGISAGRPSVRATSAVITRSSVPFSLAMPKKKVTPATRIRMATGNPAITSRSVMPARPGPTAQAATNISRPTCTPRRVANAKTATKMTSAPTGANEGGIAGHHMPRLNRRGRCAPH